MKSLFTLILIAFSFSANAELKTIDSLKCYSDRYEQKFSIQLGRFQHDTETNEATLSRYKVAVVDESTLGPELGPFQSVDTISSKEKRFNVAYQGRRYKNHVKFDLLEGETEGDLYVERMNLIISSDYKVVKEVKHQNYWHPEVKWTEEFRQFSAVLDLSFNDHHGDYVPLKCIARVSIH